MELLKYLDTESDKLHEENISSSDEFRTVNHSFVEGFNYALAIVQGFELELNENQQVVLEWLKEEKEERCSFESAIYWYFEDDVEPDIISDRLTQREFLQVLASFAEWALEQEEE